MLSICQRHDTVISQACRATPHHDIPVPQRHSQRALGAALTAEQENSRYPE